jgi:hypothetical protein
MDKIKNLIIVFFGITILVGLIGAVIPTTTQGQGGSKDVNVVNTPTVQAQQAELYLCIPPRKASTRSPTRRDRIKREGI